MHEVGITIFVELSVLDKQISLARWALRTQRMPGKTQTLNCDVVMPNTTRNINALVVIYSLHRIPTNTVITKTHLYYNVEVLYV